MKFVKFLLRLLLFVACIPSSVRAQAPTIVLVQHTSKDAGTASASALAFNSNNTAGNWIGVVIRAGLPGEVFTVSDSRGNAYRMAMQFNETGNGNTLGIFFAENIAGGANTITVRDTAAGTLRFAILEYSGLATSNSLEGSVAAQGRSTTASSGNMTTTTSGDLLLGAIVTANPANFTGASNYVVQERVPAAPNTKLVVEDQVGGAAGSALATATLSVADNWAAGLAAFKAAGVGGGIVPSITTVGPTSGPVGASITITGTNLGASQGSSTVTFNGTIGSPAAWSSTSITVPVPVGATTGNVVVTVGGVASNGVAFAVTTPAPSITGLNPTSGVVGTSVTIAGANFGASQGTSTVKFGATTATPTSWSAASIVATVPAGAATGSVVVTVGGVASNGVVFAVATSSPSITNLSPSSGMVGTAVTITGTNLGASQGSSTVAFNGMPATPASWSATSILISAPAGATTGSVVVNVGGVPSNGMTFSIVSPPPSITMVSPASGPVGASVTITGTNLGATQGTSTVSFNGTAGTPASWSMTSIVVPVPSGATTGNVVATIAGTASNGSAFTVLTPALIAFVQVNSATPQTPQTTVTVRYTLAQRSGDLNVVVVGWSDSTAKVSSVLDSMGNAYSLAVGPLIQTGVATQAIYYAKNIAAAAANVNTVTVTFTVAARYADIRIAEYSGADTVNPLDVSVGVQGNSSMSSSGTVATTNANDLLVGANLVQSMTSGPGTGFTRRVTTSPDGDILEDRLLTATGSYSATAPVSPSAPWIMQMAAFRAANSGGPALSITSLNPTSGFVGASVTITGSNFGATQGTSTVTFGGIRATPTSWSAGSIVAPVPAGATTGNVVVTVGGVASNGASFTVTVPVPSITGLNPASGLIGATVTIAGANFGPTQGTSSVKFNGITATPTSWSATSIVATVPAGAATGNVVVTVGGVASNGVNFTVQAETTPPTVSLTAPSAGANVSATVSVTASASDNVAVASVQFQLDGANLGSLDTVAPYSVSWNTATASNGSHTLQAIATDTSNNSTTSSSVTVQVSNSTSPVAWPLKESANRRYLVDQNNVPVLVMGDAAHSLMSAIGLADISTYMSTRASQGFNAVEVIIPCTNYVACPPSMASFSGVAPFTSGSSGSNYDLSTPNSAYWTIVDNVVATAAANNLVVFFNPIETATMFPMFEMNGTTKVFNYGAFLGNRYKNSPNIVWDLGNDFQNWNSDPTDNNLVLQLMLGIMSADTNHLMDIELNYNSSYSNQDTLLTPVTLDAAYTYYETYDIVLKAYNSAPTLPVVMIEANYEGESNMGFLANPSLLRRQAWWTVTSGATAQMYGSRYTNHFISGWQSNMNSPGALEMKYVAQLFNTIPWQNLVPEQTHQVVTAGYGTYNGGNANLNAANYVTTAWATDGSLAVIYDPAGNTLTVNLAKFSGPVTARWYDPSNGTFTVITGSPFANNGSHVFTTPGANHDGNPDWVLVLQ